MRKLPLLIASVMAGATLVSTAGTAHAAPNHEPLFQLPFPGGETWVGGTYTNHDGAAGSEEPIDFNKQGTSGDGDLHEAVDAAAYGTVTHADSSSSTRSNWGGYGRDVVIDHGNGWTSRYGHLRAVHVTEGQTVQVGQSIGTVGDSTSNEPSSTANGGETTMSAHLHYEVRLNGALRPAKFDGINPAITASADVAIKSRNYGDDPERLCGSGYEWTDLAYLNSAGIHYGTVYLMWNGSTSRNCVVTVKHRSRGTQTATSAFLEPQGSTRTTDSGQFSSYAGPVSRVSPSCVKWGGATSGVGYTSPFEHC